MAKPAFSDEEALLTQPTESVAAVRDAGRHPRAFVVAVAAALGLAAVVGWAGTTPRVALIPAAVGGLLQADGEEAPDELVSQAEQANSSEENSNTEAAESGKERTTEAAESGAEGESGKEGAGESGDGGESVVCVANGENCMSSMCCTEPGSTCFKKNDHWASCNLTCQENMKWVDNGWQEQSEKVWDCEAMGEENTVDCSNNGEDCSTTQCCTNPASTCFRKNDHWSSCNETCNEKMKWMDNGWEAQDEKVWSCSVVGADKEPTACVANGQNCAESKCCSEKGMTCFRKNEHWSSCNATCNENMLWNNSWQKQEEKVWDCDVVA